MKTITINGETYIADKIIKTTTDIIGQDADGKEVFSFKGISDFTKFILANDATFDAAESTSTDLQQQIFDLTTQLVTLGVI